MGRLSRAMVILPPAGSGRDFCLGCWDSSSLFWGWLWCVVEDVGGEEEEEEGGK